LWRIEWLFLTTMRREPKQTRRDCSIVQNEIVRSLRDVVKPNYLLISMVMLIYSSLWFSDI
jgi:hypothetical protein